MAGHDEVGVEGLHLVQQRDPGVALLVARGVGDPDVLVGEDQHAAEDRAVLGLVQVGAVGQRGRGADQLERWPSSCRSPVSGAVSISRVGRLAPRPAQAFSLPSYMLDVRDDLRGGEETRLGEGVGDHLGAEVEVRVAVADDHGGQGLAGVQHGGGQPVPVRAGEAGVDQQRLALAGDQGGGLVLDSRRGSPRR